MHERAKQVGPGAACSPKAPHRHEGGEQHLNRFTKDVELVGVAGGRVGKWDRVAKARGGASVIVADRLHALAQTQPAQGEAPAEELCGG